MKTNKLINLLFAGAILGLVFTGCNKDEDGKEQITDSETIAAAQDDESQDAIADNTDQSIDEIVDGLEANDFSGLKSAAVYGPVITLNRIGAHVDSFPKKIKISYDNISDTVNGDIIRYSGNIYINIELTQKLLPWRNYIKRTITFNNFTVSTDSASFKINGTRVMLRQSVTQTPVITPNNIETVNKFRLDVVDKINSEFEYIVTVGDAFTDTFTRVVDHSREAIAHFNKVAGTALIWRQAFLQDTVKLTGSVWGENFRGLNYEREITSPLTVTRCALGYPVISSGAIAITNGTKTGTITYSNTGCKTVITLESDGKVKEIERKMNRKFRRWW